MNLLFSKQAEASQIILASMARQTVDEAIDCAIAELKAEAMQAAIQTDGESSFNANSSPVEAAVNVLEMQRPLQESLDGSTRSPLINTVRSYSVADLNPSGDFNTEEDRSLVSKELLSPALLSSKETLSRGLERMSQSDLRISEQVCHSTIVIFDGCFLKNRYPFLYTNYNKCSAT